MTSNILSRPEINNAIKDLKLLFGGIKENIDEVSLFGSTVKIPAEEARDIDFFVAYKEGPFDHLRRQLLSIPLKRRVVIENHEGEYTNHPDWPKEDPLRIHIILYRKGQSKFSEKLERTRIHSIDVSAYVL